MGIKSIYRKKQYVWVNIDGTAIPETLQHVHKNRTRLKVDPYPDHSYTLSIQIFIAFVKITSFKQTIYN